MYAITSFTVKVVTHAVSSIAQWHREGESTREYLWLVISVACVLLFHFQGVKATHESNLRGHVTSTCFIFVYLSLSFNPMTTWSSALKLTMMTDNLLPKQENQLKCGTLVWLLEVRGTRLVTDWWIEVIPISHIPVPQSWTQWPIRGQYPGHVITLDQSEATSQARSHDTMGVAVLAQCVSDVHWVSTI